MGKISNVYISLSGGLGQLYEFIILLLCKIFSKKIFIHHHSYKYLNKFSLLSFFVFHFAGKKTVHIVACMKMKNDLLRVYPSIVKVRILSGVITTEQTYEAFSRRSKLKTIGFISNISFEKGIEDFIDIADRMNNAGLPVSFILAGSYQNKKVQNLIQKRISMNSNINYIGPVQGIEKSNFYKSIDLLLFPTKYIHESEGIVIHEALSNGIPVITYKRGCIEQFISSKNGFGVSPSENFVNLAEKVILNWISDPNLFQSISINAFNSYQKYKSLNNQRFRKLVDEILSI